MEKKTIQICSVTAYGKVTAIVAIYGGRFTAHQQHCVRNTNTGYVNDGHLKTSFLITVFKVSTVYLRCTFLWRYVTGDRYWHHVILLPLHLFWGTIGADFFSIDDNARLHRTIAVEEVLENEDITENDWISHPLL